VRRLVVVLFALLALPLVGAGPTDLSVKPSVIVYPFSANGSTLDREASSRLATIIATEMANTGKVTVIPPTPGTERKDYLTSARSQGADYYVAGFISPLGNGVSIVEQVVGTGSGIIVYSNTGQLTTYADAAGQGDQLAAFVAQYANRGLAGIGTPPPAPSPTVAPAGNDANIGRLFGGRRRRGAASPTPKPLVSPTPAPSSIAAASVPVNSHSPAPVIPSTPAHPAATAASVANASSSATAILAITGSADPALRTFATQRVADQTHGQAADSASSACQANASNTVLSGDLGFRPDTHAGGGRATFQLTASDCAGKVLWRKSFSDGARGTQGAQIATQHAVDAAVGAYLNPPKRRH
jgi:TolB-like protein